MELYLHIPFCVQKCSYCSFCSFPASQSQMNEYVILLLDEARQRAHETMDSVETVYIGGGTPSLLPDDLLIRLVRGLKETYLFPDKIEFTSEANPGTVSESWLKTAYSLGVNRISFGMQASQLNLLQTLGRIHTQEDVVHSVKLARRAGFRHINLDLIFGIPGQTMKDWQDTLTQAISLEPDHISAYGLIPEENTPLWKALHSGSLQLPDADLERDMYDCALEMLADFSYKQYEISNFAKQGAECRHNIGYWQQIPYLGLGLSAASMLHIHRTEKGISYVRQNNPSDYAAYQKMIREKAEGYRQTETVSPPDARFETVMLSLRMVQGIDERMFFSMHHVSLESCCGEKLFKLKEEGLLAHENSFWRLSRRGMDIQNSILVELMDCFQEMD